MAEIKNSFLRSKMNKDLDDRLIPNGEYRDAQNISVGKSEADDIGSLETVLGNTLATNFGLSGMTVIGYHAIENSNKIIVFLTDNVGNVSEFAGNGSATQFTIDFTPLPNAKSNFTVTVNGVLINAATYSYDNNNGRITFNTAPIDNSVIIVKPITFNYIYEFIPSNTANLLVTGSFLNFLSTKPITGISVIENLLFWTDYNNQPRKINLTKGLGYYTNESDISVAKYNPYQPIGLLNKVSKTTTGLTGDVLSIADTTGIKKGMAVVEYGNSGQYGLEANNHVYVEDITANTSVKLNFSNRTGVVNGDTIYFFETTMTGEEITFNFNNGSPSTWPGDPDYLESKFIRLSYRFEFDDGEYSLMAPFTPITFIPKQKGFFLQGDEDATYKSTIVEFMENGVQNIELLIPFPDTLNNVQPEAEASYKIRSVDILYKESDAIAVKVIDTINYNDRDENGNTWTATTNTNILTYNYQSRKPFRTLPTNQTVRVYDKVPVKAFAQETSGNRIIYGNFLDKYSPPSFLNYTVGVSPKSTSLNFDSWAEFPTQSVKQNRNYQVGFILADKFGRQSDVILSSIKISTVTSDGTIFGGDTIYSAYNSLTENTNNPIRDWFGDSLKIDISKPITSGTNDAPADDEPGLYAISLGGYDTFQTIASGNQPSISGNTYIFKLTAGATQTTIPVVGSYLPGEFTDYVYVSNIEANTPTTGKYTVTTIGQVSSTYLQQSPSTSDVKYAYSINEIGWYSYKIVVKQQEQDYYNVYLPGILNGFPILGTPLVPSNTSDQNKLANIVLINDNINKIPRDLSEVGPDQKQFRSSVQLFGRVTNNMTTGTANNLQYYPGTNPVSHTAISISTADDSGMAYADLASPGGRENLYEVDTNPLIARLSTTNGSTNPIGVISTTVANTNMLPFLAIYETEPVESLLDIFWETPTVGLISDLNDAIKSNYTGAVGWEPFTSSNFKESNTGNFITGLRPVDQSGAPLNNTSISNISVTNQVPAGVTEGFVNPVERTGTAGTPADPFKYNFSKVADQALWPNGFAYNENAELRNFTITSTITNLTTGVVSNPLNIDIQLQNEIPTITGAPTLPVINNNTAASGVIVDVNGFNGAIRTASNQDELQWSMTGGGAYFAINSSTGQITQTSAAAGTYNLLITLKDANGTGASSAVTTQQVVVSSTAVGFAFTAGQADGNVTQVCPLNGSVAPTCGSITYYNTTTNSGTPQVNDIISTQEFNIVPAGRGFYSFDCNPSNTGTSRKYFFIDTSPAGKVVAVTNCT